jgi:hypothetical protein
VAIVFSDPSAVANHFTKDDQLQTPKCQDVVACGIERGSNSKRRDGNCELSAGALGSRNDVEARILASTVNEESTPGFCYGLNDLMVLATGRKLPLVSSIW